jgi:hypothetical protein
MINCEHWQDCGVSRGGCCAVNEYQRPSFGVCLLVCEKNTDKPSKKKANKMLGVKKSKGFGDTVKKIIDKVTGNKVKPCGGCEKRRKLLNKLIPYDEDKDNGN